MGKLLRYVGTADVHKHYETRFERNGDPQTVDDATARQLLATGEFEDCGGANGPSKDKESDPTTPPKSSADDKPEQPPQADLEDEDAWEDEGGASKPSSGFKGFFGNDA